MDGAVAITGMGAVTAQGVGVAATWEGVVQGREVLGAWERLPEGHALRGVKVARCVAELPRPADLPERLWRRLSRTQQLACVASDEAVAQAGLPRRVDMELGANVGLFVATTVCGMDVNECFYAQYRADPQGADRDLMRRLQPHEVGELLGRRHGVGYGPGLRQVCLSTCVGSAMAIGTACDAILLGECDTAIAGGSEAMCRVVLSGFHSLKVTAAEGCRPFDRNRPGMTVGEGAGMLVLESVVSARKRGAKVLGYVRGFGVTCDAYHLTAPEAQGVQAARAMRDALSRAGTRPEEIGYLNAHGTGTRDNDAMETRAIRAVFGPDEEAMRFAAEVADKGGCVLMSAPPPMPAVSSTKRCTGHTFGAAGAVEAIVCVQAVREGIVPGNAGSVEGDPALELRVLRGGSEQRNVRAAMSTNFAFGGNNTALVIGREER
jgi:3-oxoacyl-(acyl-carrier-protein) synthase